MAISHYSQNYLPSPASFEATVQIEGRKLVKKLKNKFIPNHVPARGLLISPYRVRVNYCY